MQSTVTSHDLRGILSSDWLELLPLYIFPYNGFTINFQRVEKSSFRSVAEQEINKLVVNSVYSQHEVCRFTKKATWII